MHEEATTVTPTSDEASASEPSLEATAARLHQDIGPLSQAIGPRGSTTEDEAKATHSVAERLASFGLAPQRQNFDGAASAYAPYALAMFMGLLSLFLFWQQLAIVTIFAVVFTAVALASLWRELAFKDNVLRWVLYKDPSQNVFVEFAAKNPQPKAKIVITTHVDTHRTPLVSGSPSLQRVWQLAPLLSLVSLVVLLALFLMGLLIDAVALRWAALLPGAVALLVFGLALQADSTPFTHGANDNASGVAVGLELVSRLAQSPLNNHDVTLVFTGCGETGSYGADAFLCEQKAALGNAIYLVIAHVGGKDAHPCFIRSEQLWQPAPSDPALLKLANELIAAHPELNAHSRSVNGAHSELSIGTKHGLRTIGLFGLAKGGAVPHQHQPSDMIENVDAEAAARAAELAWLFLQAVDT